MNRMTHKIHIHGRSLVELMVAILVGSLVLAAVLVIVSGSTSIGRRSDSLGTLSDSGQVALQILASEIQMAGYSAPRTSYTAGYITKLYPYAGIRGCDNGFSNNAAANQLAILACNNAGNSSAVSVTYEADAFNSTLVNGGVPSDCRGFGLVSSVPGGVGNSAPPPDLSTDVVAYWLVENRYSIAVSNGEPTLVCSGNGAGAFSSSVPLIRGVERMLITYGIGTGNLDLSKGRPDLLVVTPNVTTYMTANQIDTNAEWAGEATDVRWQRVVSARICLEMRGDVGSAEAGVSFVNCDGILTAINDRRARKAIYRTVNLRNRTSSQTDTIGLGGV